MSTHAELRDEDLQAFVDGELDDSNKERIQALVTTSQELQEQIAGYRADKARIRALYSGGLTDPLPREWVERIEEATTRKSWQRQVWRITALAASVVLVLSGVIAFREYSGHRDDIVADALAARGEVLQPDRIVPVSSTRVADSEAVAMTRALAVKVRAPDLSRMGYRLAGIDAYSAPQRSFQLRYVGAGGRVFTLYVRRSTEPRFALLEEQGLRVCVWQDSVIGIVMAGKMSAAEMERLAGLAYEGLEGLT